MKDYFRKPLYFVGGIIFTACELFQPSPSIENPNTTEQTTEVEEEENYNNGGGGDDSINDSNGTGGETGGIDDIIIDDGTGVIDDGTGGETGGEEPEVVEPVERGDLLTTINTLEYKVGDIFNYSGRIQSARTTEIYTDSNIGDLELTLKKEGLSFYNNFISDNFSVRFKEQGYMEFEYEDDNMRVMVSNVELDYQGQHVVVNHPVIMAVNFDTPPYIFEESGNYSVDISIRYLFEEETYESVFTSEEFVVGE